MFSQNFIPIIQTNKLQEQPVEFFKQNLKILLYKNVRIKS